MNKLFNKESKEKDGVPKKLKDFYDEKASQIKKFKSLVSYCGMFVSNQSLTKTCSKNNKNNKNVPEEIIQP